MAQQYGLGRGLASLIPPKNKVSENNDSRESRAVIASGHFEPRSAKGEMTSSEKDLSQASETKQVVSEPVIRDGGEQSLIEVPVARIVANPHQPRLHFDEARLVELAESISEHGILQPLVVTKVNDKLYELIAGERRLQAAKRAGLETVPVIVRDVDEQTKLELAIIENIQRHNLNPIEEAKAYMRLVNEFSLSQEAVAQKMGKKRSTVANTLRLLHLPVEIQRAVAEGRLSEGHAKALLAIDNQEKQRALFEIIIKEELTVRETEARVKEVSVRSHIRVQKNLAPELQDAMSRLGEQFGTKVKIIPGGKGGKVVFEYFSPEELDGLLGRWQG